MLALYPTHIGFSHYIWAELLFGNILLLSVYFFVLFTENRERNKYLFASFIIAGFGLLAKEFAVVFVAGFTLTLLFLQFQNKIRRISMACVLFLLPGVLYSATASCITNRVIVLNDAIILNLHRATDTDPNYEYSFDKREEMVHQILANWKQKKASEVLRTAKGYFYELWGPDSFLTKRLIGRGSPDPQSWSYGILRPRPWVFLAVAGYLFVVVTGLAGLCLSKPTPFRTFAITTLICLSLLSIFAKLVSRYRLPFMPIFIIYSAYFLVNTRQLKKKLPTMLFLITLVLFLFDIVRADMHHFYHLLIQY